MTHHKGLIKIYIFYLIEVPRLSSKVDLNSQARAKIKILVNSIAA